MAPADSLARFRKHVLDRVERGEVSVVEACADAGISRPRFYQLRQRYRLYGEAGLRPTPRPARPDRQLSAPLRDQILALAVELPTLGPRALADRLALERYGGHRVSPGGVYNVLRRAGLARRLARLAAAESLAAAEGGPITERALRELRATDRAKTMHLGSDQVGAELFADTMSIGKLKGVGTVWQYSVVDGACSMGFGGVRSGRKTATRMAAILEAQVVPAYRRAGITIRAINTDGGPEFGRAFRRACQRLGIFHRRLPPRSPNLNAFVERWQGTCLHEHYRVAFRYRYYTCVEDIDADFQSWRRHYNFERPHRGYRTKGRRPAELFYAHRPDLLRRMGWRPDEFTSIAQAV